MSFTCRLGMVHANAPPVIIMNVVLMSALCERGMRPFVRQLAVRERSYLPRLSDCRVCESSQCYAY